MSKKTVLLLNPPLFFHLGEPHSLDISLPPLGLLHLASYANHYSQSFKVEVLDIGRQKINISKVLAYISKVKPIVIGISSMTPQLQGAVELAQKIKEKNKIPIFLGGPHISADPGFIKRNPNIFDYAITGEAEKTFYQSVSNLLLGKKIPQIQIGKIQNNLDNLPVTDKKLIQRQNYSQKESIMFSRGCPFSCYYCSRPAIDRRVRYHSPQYIIKEIKQSLPFSKGLISFQDDTFTFDSAAVKKLCHHIIKEKIDLSWDCNTRIDLVDQSLLQIMKQAGCYQINFGIESGSERVRKEIIHKGNFTNKDIVKVFNLCRNLNIKIACYYMIGHPTETTSELEETINMIKSTSIDILGLSIPIPFPGSPLFEIAKSEKQISLNTIDDFAHKKLGEGYSGIYPCYHTKTIKPGYLLQKMASINRHFYFKPKIIIKHFLQNIFHPQLFINDLSDFFSLIANGTSTRKPYKIKK